MATDSTWLTRAMTAITDELGRAAGQPLILTLITWDEGAGELTQLTVSSRAPGRIYRRVLDSEEITRLVE